MESGNSSSRGFNGKGLSFLHRIQHIFGYNRQRTTAEKSSESSKHAVAAYHRCGIDMMSVATMHEDLTALYWKPEECGRSVV